MSDFQRFIEQNNLLKKDVAEYLGVSNAFITQLCTGSRAVPADKLKLIKANDLWDSSMLDSPTSVNAKAINNSRVNVEIGSHNTGAAPQHIAEQAVQTIPVIPIDAVAGPIAEYTSAGVLASQCERMISPIAGATCAIRVSGDSMASEYNSGDLCILKKVNPDIFIEWGKVYVLDTENGAVLKKVVRSEEKGKVQCVSINPDYEPFDLRTDCVYGWYRVMALMALK